MAEKTCCVTGHRDIPEARIAYVEQELRREVEEAIAEGYTRFISGFAEGVDLMFAAIVVEQMEHRRWSDTSSWTGDRSTWRT